MTNAELGGQKEKLKMNKVNEKGIELLHDFEKLRFRAYDDAQPNVVLTEKTAIKGHLTIGWGQTGKWIKWDSQIDRVKADELFLESLEYAESIVKKLIKVPLNDNQYSALVSFAYNSGGGYNSKKYNKWTPYELWRFINEKKDGLKAKWLSTAVTSKGKPLKGLINRRTAEYELFMSA